MPQANFPEIEEKMLKFWKEKNIFQKTLALDSAKKQSSGKNGAAKDFVFYDGPPFATGTPHYGHIVASLIKDIVPRYWTMQGYHVERRWGWDCHGLPIENIVEEELNLKCKKDIEDLGIEKFNQTCRSKVLLYAEEWRKVVERMGRWVDMDNAYKTMDLDYMESIWWVFKELWDKDLIYQGYKSMHICPRCETTLSQSEVTQGYKDIEDISAIAKFELMDASQRQPNALSRPNNSSTYILAWTTTPWTLIGNVALAIGKGIKYVKVKSGQDYYILGQDNLEKIFENKKYEIIGEIKVKDLEGKRYKPLFDYFENVELENKENLYTIQLADFVTIEDGTGVVHVAPAFGEDDMNLGQEKKLSFIQHVQMDGRFTQEIKDFAGLEVKPKENHQSTDEKIVDYLTQKGLVFKSEPFIHSYPHCWRCDSPLINYATSSWFVKVTQIKDKIIKNAENIHWMPEHIKEGRFGKWLEGARDWSISRQRFWGSVMPIWICEKCGEKKVIGSIKELEKLSGQKIIDLHKHVIDKIEFKCAKCDGKMKRVPDVLDCWFESGSMPYAQMHYPFENKELIDCVDKNRDPSTSLRSARDDSLGGCHFPAQFIAEGVDQTRCWFYYLNVLSVALKNSHAFKNVIANGIVLVEDGKKMSKRLKNYPEPMEVFNKYGADAVRYYLATSPVMKADDLCFVEKDVEEVVKKLLLILWNVFSFYQIYADQNADLLRGSNADQISDISVSKISDRSAFILDRWIIAKFNLLVKEVTEGYDNYDLNQATRPILDFINELSTWYLRRSRSRFKSDNKKDKLSALKTLRCILFNLSKLMAPVMPFISDHIYQAIGGEKESVHLENWPTLHQDWIDQKIIEQMEIVREVAGLGLEQRAMAGFGVRQPLAKITVKFPGLKKLDKELEQLILDELNVKEIVYQPSVEKSVSLDIKLTAELKMEGLRRELVRQINDLRKKAGLTIKDKIILYYQTKDKDAAQVIKELLADVLAERAEEERKSDVLGDKNLETDFGQVWLGIEKINLII